MSGKTVVIYHNILWPRYKGEIFSRLYEMFTSSGDAQLNVVHIAESEGYRLQLGSIDRSVHSYPYKVLFNGSYDLISPYALLFRCFWSVVNEDAAMVVLPGYHRAEYWGMLVAAKLRGMSVGVFCDSTAQDRPATIWKSTLKRLFFSSCDVIFVYGVRGAQYVTSHGFPADRVVSGCQASALPARPLGVVNRARQDILYVGRLSAEKGLKDLLDAFAEISDAISPANLIIAGSGPMSEELAKYSIELRVSDRVFFVGSKTPDELSCLYLESKLLVLPSLSEPWGLVVNEAMALGCPALVSDVCGCIPELIVNGETGMTFRAGDISDLAAKIVLGYSQFSNSELTSAACIRQVSEIKPERAASALYGGINSQLLRRTRQ